MLPTTNFTMFVDLYKFHPSICCLLRMCNVNVTYFYNLCIYLNTSNNNKNFQVAGITIGLTAASLLYATFRAGSNPNVTDFQIDSLVNDLTRDQTAAQNIISSLAYVSRQTSYVAIQTSTNIQITKGCPNNSAPVVCCYIKQYSTGAGFFGHPVELNKRLRLDC